MGGGALVVVVAWSIVAVSIPVGLWLRRTPRYSSIPRPPRWLLADETARRQQEWTLLTRPERKLVWKAVTRGTAVTDPVLAPAAYRLAREQSAHERARLTSYPRGLVAGGFLGFLLFSPGLLRGHGLMFGESGVVDSVLLLLFATVFVTEAVRSPTSLRLSERAEEVNSELIPAEPHLQGKSTHRRLIRR